MTDTSPTSTPGERLDQAIGEARTLLDELRGALVEFGSEFRDQLAEKIDEVSAKIDEVQAAWAERRAES